MGIKELMQIAGKGTVKIRKSRDEHHNQAVIESMLRAGYTCTVRGNEYVFKLEKRKKKS